LVHPDQFEDKVCKRREKYDNYTTHRKLLFPPCTPCRENQEGYCEREHDNGDVEFVILIGTLNLFRDIAGGWGDNDDKLDCKSYKEEEIEFEQSNENL
jgi:hypothetical protein